MGPTACPPAHRSGEHAPNRRRAVDATGRRAAAPDDPEPWRITRPTEAWPDRPVSPAGIWPVDSGQNTLAQRKVRQCRQTQGAGDARACSASRRGVSVRVAGSASGRCRPFGSAAPVGPPHRCRRGVGAGRADTQPSTKGRKHQGTPGRQTPLAVRWLQPGRPRPARDRRGRAARPLGRSPPAHPPAPWRLRAPRPVSLHTQVKDGCRRHPRRTALLLSAARHAYHQPAG